MTEPITNVVLSAYSGTRKIMELVAFNKGKDKA